MKHGWAVVAAVLCAGSASAQLGGISARAGYFWGSDFTGGNNQSINLNGISIGADFGIFKDPISLVEIRLSPEVTFGGITAKGGDADADLYRILATAKTALPGTGFYAQGGLGYGWASDRGSTNVGTSTGLIFKAGVGMDLGNPVGIGPRPFLEASYYFGQDTFTGLAFEVGIRF